jgi:type IV secretion system protein VirB6
VGFFADFFTWLTAQLSTYIGTMTGRMAGAIAPAATTLATIYVMLWGYLHLRGAIEEPIMDGIKRIVALGVILGIGLHLWSYNTLLVDTFSIAPRELAANILGAPNPVGIVDQIWTDGNLVAESLMAQGGVLSGDFMYYLMGFAVYLFVGITCVYTAFLLALSEIAVSVILAIGPMFILFLLFEPTKRFFESWVAQLANYALITILVALAAGLLLSVVQAFSHAAVASGSGVTIAEAVRLCVGSVLIFLVMRQVMSMAAGLASGIALSSYNTVSRAMAWATGGTSRSLYQMGRGLADKETTRWDSLRRKAGFGLGQGARALAGQVGRIARPNNTIQRARGGRFPKG